MKITNLFKFDYWTDLRPRYFDEKVTYIFLAILIATFLAAIIVFFLKKRSSLYKRVLSKIYSLLLSNLIIVGLIFFFRFELVPFLSARFWMGIWAITLFIWIFFIIKEAKKIPIKKQLLEKEIEKNKVF
jgi:amino acid transporter